MATPNFLFRDMAAPNAKTANITPYPVVKGNIPVYGFKVLTAKYPKSYTGSSMLSSRPLSGVVWPRVR